MVYCNLLKIENENIREIIDIENRLRMDSIQVSHETTMYDNIGKYEHRYMIKHKQYINNIKQILFDMNIDFVKDITFSYDFYNGGFWIQYPTNKENIDLVVKVCENEFKKTAIIEEFNQTYIIFIGII